MVALSSSVNWTHQRLPDGSGKRNERDTDNPRSPAELQRDSKEEAVYWHRQIYLFSYQKDPGSHELLESPTGAVEQEKSKK